MSKLFINIFGIIFILLGFVFFLVNGSSTQDFDLGHYIGIIAPTLVMIPIGLYLHLRFFSDERARKARNIGVGGFLIVGGIFAQIAMAYDSWTYMWPGMLIALSVGLLEIYIFADRSIKFILSSSVLFVLSLIFFMNVLGEMVMGNQNQKYIYSIGFFLIGLLLLFINGFSKTKQR
ncbi:hypothetical protein BC351_29005 [Paenibacillus ferrarius]|uniref:DUF5668 domain-containing protein n=1 Tax=Paenibacillus ferrarius TaxID=1469647 RepID=A0A1V4HHD5_9BACL|nr:hypothetical protein [Paenibacillus ferrarius]OPH56209.1 hypothetical protein BC351_29005 [Paenibacillus ferrarius]